MLLIGVFVHYLYAQVIKILLYSIHLSGSVLSKTETSDHKDLQTLLISKNLKSVSNFYCCL